MKNMTVPVAVGVAIIGCVLAVSANVTTSKIHKDLDQERYKRIIAEKELQKATNQIKQLERQLGDAESKVSSIRQIIEQGNSEVQNLQTQLEALSKEKSALRQQLKQFQSGESGTGKL